MSQFALPLTGHPAGMAGRIVVGIANAVALEALARPVDWPFRTAILFGPPRSGKSLLARWFVENGGDAVDDAETLEEDALFHRWNRAQESGRPLLIVSNTTDGAWRPALPDLASRIGAALRLGIGAPDDAMLAELIALHAEARGLHLDAHAEAYLVPRCERSHIGVERLVATIDRLSLERKLAPTLSIWRDALAEIAGGGAGMGPGGGQPRLL